MIARTEHAGRSGEEPDRAEAGGSHGKSDDQGEKCEAGARGEPGSRSRGHSQSRFDVGGRGYATTVQWSKHQGGGDRRPPGDQPPARPRLRRAQRLPSRGPRPSHDKGPGGNPPEPLEQDQRREDRDDVPVYPIQQRNGHALAGESLPLPKMNFRSAATPAASASTIAFPNFWSNPVFASTAPAPPATSAVSP